MDNIVQIISTTGFPIAMVLILCWYVNKLSDSHKEESTALKESINKLEVAITALITKLGE